MVSAALAKTCIRHPQRAGFAVCMACRQVVCQECATTWDGINFCRDCLAKRGALGAVHARWRTAASALGVMAASIGLFIAAAHSMVWALAMIIDWR